MRLNLNLEIADEDVGRLGELLERDPKALADVLAGHAQAALAEYVEMYLGRRPFTRGSDILELRLALLTQFAFAGRVASEDEVAHLFQLTLSRARSLLRASNSRYRRELRTVAVRSAKVVLESARKGADDSFVLEARAESVIDFMNEALRAGDARQKVITRMKENVGTWSVARGAYEFLCKALGAKPAEG